MSKDSGEAIRAEPIQPMRYVLTVTLAAMEPGQEEPDPWCTLDSQVLADVDAYGPEAGLPSSILDRLSVWTNPDATAQVLAEAREAWEWATGLGDYPKRPEGLEPHPLPRLGKHYRIRTAFRRSDGEFSWGPAVPGSACTGSRGEVVRWASAIQKVMRDRREITEGMYLWPWTYTTILRGYGVQPMPDEPV